MSRGSEVKVMWLESAEIWGGVEVLCSSDMEMGSGSVFS